LFALGVAVALIAKGSLDHDSFRVLVVALYLAGALNALFAVPVAVFLLVRRPHYICRANVVMTLLACIPFALLLVVVFTLGIGPRLHI
jgi:hypothetical protein